MKTVKIPQILLPATDDMTAWAVNACDQFTSDKKYWEKVERAVKGRPSAYNLVLPEIYLDDKPEKRIKRINKNMRKYLSGGIFKEAEEGFILVERTTQSGTRTGIVIAIDLEDYSFSGEPLPVRSTEATITERIPPRVKIREDAPLELPHVMLLYDDKKGVVLDSVKRGEVLYDFDLMCGGGHVKGVSIENSAEVADAFYSLCDGQKSLEKLLFAVGDGNHSLAAAKTCWENLKNSLPEEARKNHPARFALVEAVNVYDPAINFGAIHRLVKTDKTKLFADGLKTSGSQKAYIVIGGKRIEIPFPDDIPAGIRQIDGYISDFIKNNGGAVDYIHGESEIEALTSDGGVGIILPPIKKDDFFKQIIRGGNLPRKTFSLGEGCEKRYYIEARAIK